MKDIVARVKESAVAHADAIRTMKRSGKAAGLCLLGAAALSVAGPALAQTQATAAVQGGVQEIVNLIQYGLYVAAAIILAASAIVAAWSGDKGAILKGLGWGIAAAIAGKAMDIVGYMGMGTTQTIN